MVAFAERYVDLLERELPRESYLVGGWSIGGLVALEVATLLQERGRRVGLVLGDTMGPELAKVILEDIGDASMTAREKALLDSRSAAADFMGDALDWPGLREVQLGMREPRSPTAFDASRGGAPPPGDPLPEPLHPRGRGAHGVVRSRVRVERVAPPIACR